MCLCIPKFIIINSLNLLLITAIFSSIDSLILSTAEYYLVTTAVCIYPLVLYRFPYTFLVFLNIFLIFRRLDIIDHIPKSIFVSSSTYDYSTIISRITDKLFNR